MSGISDILPEFVASEIRGAAGWPWAAGWQVTVTVNRMQRQMMAPAGWLDGGADGGSVGNGCHVAGENCPVGVLGGMGGQLTSDGDDAG